MTSHPHYRRTVDLDFGVVCTIDPAFAAAAALDVWVGEGGALAAPAGPVPPLQRSHPGRGKRAPQDTAQGCRERASADRIRAADSSAGEPRWRYEHSANAWTQRAELLDRIEASALTRQKQNAGGDC